MKDRAEYFYSQQKLHLVFGVVTLALIGLMALVVYDDWAREWKQYQLAYRDMDVQRTAAELEAARQRDEEAIAAAREQLASAQETLAGNAEALAAVEEEDKLLRAEADRARMDYQIQKAILDEVKYKFEHAKSDPHGSGGDHARRAAELERLQQEYTAADRLTEAKYQAYMAAEASVAFAHARRNELTRVRDEAEQQIKRAEFETARLERKLKSIRPNLVNDAFRNLPLLDFINPSLRIQQVMIDGIRDDLHFTSVGKIDRCHTCHVAIDKPGFEDAPQPLATHPDLHLYVSDDSPHPLRLYGCTVCHEGNGMATEFERAAHTPRDYAQQEEWEEKYGWHKLHHWDFPMLKKGNEQASCLKCHENPEEIPEAEVLLKGHNIFVQNGCYSCHSIDKEPYRNLRKPGPTLAHLAQKLTPSFVARWVANPWSYRPDSTMPRLFGNEGTDTPLGRQQDAVMVEAITRYLFSHSSDLELLTPPAEAGDPAKGRELVRTVGCMACHAIDDIGQDFVADPQFVASGFGPNLSTIGTKVNRQWLFNWLLDPAKMWPETNMPSMRLSHEEANDISAYLLSLRDEEYLASPRPPVEAAIVDQLIAEDWKGRMPDADAREKLATMSDDEKLLYLGERGIATKNCYSCHEVQGFEKLNPVVISFTKAGSKDMTQLNFGFVPYHHPTHEQLEAAEHQGEPVAAVHHLPHAPEERFLQVARGAEGLTGAATLRYPDVFGRQYVPYATDANPETPRADDVFVPKYRFDWYFNQVKNPALWDRGVLKAFWEQQRMGQFGLTDDEAHAVSMFISGHVHSVIRAEYTDTLADQRRKALTEGRAVLKNFNCYACHTLGLYEDTISFELRDPSDPDERYGDGATATVDLGRQRVWTAADVFGREEVFDEEGNPTGTFAPAPKKVFHKDQWLTGDMYDAAAGENVPVSTYAGYYYLEGQDIPVLGLHEGWIRQYYPQVNQAPPMLYRQGEKTDYDWLFSWLQHVHTIRPGLQVRMPQYAFTDEEATKIVALFAAMNDQAWPYATREAPSTDPELVALGEKVFAELLLCNQCHPAGQLLPTGEDVSAWGPNLALVPQRFTKEWLVEWLRNPQAIYPGTAMPNNFYLPEEGGLTPLLGTEEEMDRYIEAVIAWIHQLDPRQSQLDYAAIRADIAARVAARAAAESASAEEGDDAGGAGADASPEAEPAATEAAESYE